MEKLDFGKKLIGDRLAQGFTQEQLAEACNINVRTIQRIESGEVQPRLYTMKVISDVLETNYFNTSNSIDYSHSLIKPDKNFGWYFKDLFNLKTQKMKKISIIGLFVTMVLFGAFQFASILSPGVREPKHGLSIYLNNDGSTKRIDVVYSNILTFDSLVDIRKTLSEKGITLEYERICFDERGGLAQIECKVNCNDGFSGGFSADSLTTEKWTGFSRDYSEKSKVAFCAGPCFK